MKRIRWYHFYILLAGFDVIVIAVGWWMHHRTLTRFEAALYDAGRMRQQQAYLIQLRRDLTDLNAPGNDVFRTHDIAGERARYATRYASLLKRKERSAAAADRLRDFWDEVAEMAKAEAQIFDALQGERAVQSVETAAVHMAHMDSHQGVAIQLLEREQKALLDAQAEMLMNQKLVLERQTFHELGFGVALVVALLGMFWYIRKLQKTDEALQAERARVENERRERLASIGELCSGVAHGIQNPLAAIHSSTELILDLGHIDQATRQRACDVLSECARLSQRVARLLNFARATARQRERVSLAGVVAGVQHEFHPQFEHKKVRIHVDSPPPSATVLADPDELASVFVELFSNALAYAPAGSDVRITYPNGRAGFVTVEVADQGPGVPENAAGKIFDLFFTTRPGGTGVGLAWARRIVESMGGTLEVDGSRREGAVFQVTLPLAP